MKLESKRARILRMVLDFINGGDWEEGDGFLIFGSDAYDRHLGIEPAADEPAREPVETKATRKRKARLAAQQRAQEPVTRVAKAPAAKAAPATAPSAQAASKKKGKGAGFVSANPYQ